MTETSKVVSLRGHPLPADDEPDADVVSALSEALEIAKAGKIEGVMVVYLYRDGDLGGRRAGTHNYGLVGMIERIRADIVDVIRSRT